MKINLYLCVSEIDSHFIDKLSLKEILSKNETFFLSTMNKSEYHHSILQDECLALLSMPIKLRLEWETAEKTTMEHLNIDENDNVESTDEGIY